MGNDNIVSADAIRKDLERIGLMAQNNSAIPTDRLRLAWSPAMHKMAVDKLRQSIRESVDAVG